MNPSRLVAIITAADAATRDRSVDSVCRDADLATLLAETEALVRRDVERWTKVIREAGIKGD